MSDEWNEALRAQFGERLPSTEQVDIIRGQAWALFEAMDYIDGPGLAVYHKAAHDLALTLDLTELDARVAAAVLGDAS